MIYRGIVQKGDQRGTVLGFPTANIPLEGGADGIYAAKVMMDGQEYPAAVYADTKRKILEAHILDFPYEELYGKAIEVSLLQKLRDHVDFPSDLDVKVQIQNDIRQVNEFFSQS